MLVLATIRYVKNQPNLYDFFFIEEYKNARLAFIKSESKRGNGNFGMYGNEDLSLLYFWPSQPPAPSCLSQFLPATPSPSQLLPAPSPWTPEFMYALPLQCFPTSNFPGLVIRHTHILHCRKFCLCRCKMGEYFFQWAFEFPISHLTQPLTTLVLPLPPYSANTDSRQHLLALRLT